MRCFSHALLIISVWLCHGLVGGQTFERVKYNNPGLVVDLGVGLWAWPLPIDYDKDGDLDLVVSCPDVPYQGLYFFENREGPGVTFPVFEPAVKIGGKKKNLQISYVDGKPKVMGPGVEYKQFAEKIFLEESQVFDASSLESLHEKIRFSQWKMVDYDMDGDIDLLAGIDDWGDYGWDNAFDESGQWTNGPLHGYVYLLENDGGTLLNRGRLEADGSPIDVYGAPSPNMEDFDGDGDLDLICGEFLDRFTWFENIGTRKDPVFASGRFLHNALGAPLKMDLEMITPSAVDWDQDGDIDLVVGDEDGRVALVENTGRVVDQMPIFKRPRYFKQKADDVKFGALVTPFSVDWDDDGDEDLICGNTAGYIGFIENLDGGKQPKWAAPVRLEAYGREIRIMAGENGSIQGPAEQKWGYTTLSVTDWDGDGLKDIIINSIWGRVQWIQNIGKRGKPRLGLLKDVSVDWEGRQIAKPEWNWWNPAVGTLATQWRTTPQALDWNGDGLVDLIMLDHEGYLSYYERKLKNGKPILTPGQRIFYLTNAKRIDRKNNIIEEGTSILQLNNAKYGASGRRKFCFADWDGDGDRDLIVNGINAAWFENLGEENGLTHLVFRGDVSTQRLAGHTTSPTMVDWDGDGKPTLLLGAEDGFLYLWHDQH